jgi:hypothetical protein
MERCRLPNGGRLESTRSGSGRSPQSGLHLLDDRSRARAFHRAVRRGRQSDHESPLYELPSGYSSADPRRRSSRARALDVWRTGGSRSARIALPLMPWNGEHADAGVIDYQRPRKFAVEARPSVDGMARQVLARDLSPTQGRRAERGTNMRNPRAYGKDPLVGWAWHPARDAPAPGTQAQFGRYSGVDLHRCAMSPVLTWYR